MNRVFIIAEAGVNHNGSIDIAKDLIDVSAEAGADAVKFQTFKAENIICKTAQKADYQKVNTSPNETQYDMLKKLELTKEIHLELIDYCSSRRITFLSSAFDIDSIKTLNSFGMTTYKIPSGEITNLPYLRFIGGLRCEIILSTGMSDYQDIQNALNILLESGASLDQITILHTTSQYPCPIEEVNLNAMCNIGEMFNVKYGYSDHTMGIEVPIAAAALGATVIEKHLTLNQKMNGPDHAASLNPDNFKKMVSSIRTIEKSLGDGKKKPTISELKNMKLVRKSIVAAREIKAGEIFSSDNLCVKRPGYGISPMLWDSLIGVKAKRDFIADELIEI